MKRSRQPLGLLFVAGIAACDGAGGTAPSLVAPEPPAFTARFVQQPLRVAEGETAEVAIQYRVNELSSPLELAVSALDGTAAAGDYELSATSFQIPAGRGTTGTAAISLTALTDNSLAEGEETMSLRLVQPSGIRAQLDQNLEITIADTGVSPCPAVEALASRIGRLEETGWVQTTLSLRFGAAAGPVQFDWTGPFLHDENCNDDDCRAWWTTRSNNLELNVVEWRVAPSAGGVEHSMDIEWWSAKEAGIRFRADAGGCAGEPTITCTKAGCELVP